MPDSLIEQVRKYAKSQAALAMNPIAQAMFEGIDFPAILAHLERTQAVCEQAGFVNNMIRKGSIVPSDFHDEETRRVIREVFVALDAALENLENRDGK